MSSWSLPGIYHFGQHGQVCLAYGSQPWSSASSLLQLMNIGKAQHPSIPGQVRAFFSLSLSSQSHKTAVDWCSSHPRIGAWCWINAEYSPFRLYLHYIWLFIAAFASISLYGHLFWRLRLHFRSRPLAVDGDPPRSADPIRKRLERKARGMLMWVWIIKKQISSFVLCEAGQRCVDITLPFSSSFSSGQLSYSFHYHDSASVSIPISFTSWSWLGYHCCCNCWLMVLSQLSQALFSDSFMIQRRALALRFVS